MVRRLISFFVVVTCLLFYIPCAFASEGYSSGYNKYDPEIGWWWYKDPPKKPKNKEKKTEQPVYTVYTYKQLWNMYPDAFQKILKIALRQAVQHPTEANVKQYLTMQDIARRKASAYTNVVSYVIQKNPQLSVYKDYPQNVPGIRSRTGQMYADIERTLLQQREHYALIFFWKPGCGYCTMEKDILAAFQDKTGWRIQPINIQEQPGAAIRFNIRFTPEVILIKKGSPKWIPVATGVLAGNRLEQNIYRAIQFFEGKTTPQNWTLYDFQKGSSFDLSEPPVKDENLPIKFKILQEQEEKQKSSAGQISSRKNVANLHYR